MVNDAFYFAMRFIFLSYEMFYLMKCFIWWNVLFDDVFYLFILMT